MRKHVVLVAALLILVLSWSFNAFAQQNSVLLPHIFGGAGTVPQPTPTPTPPTNPQSGLLDTLVVDGGGEMGRWLIAL